MLPRCLSFQLFFGESVISRRAKLASIQQSLVDATDSNARVQDRRRRLLLVFDV